MFKVGDVILTSIQEATDIECRIIQILGPFKAKVETSWGTFVADLNSSTMVKPYQEEEYVVCFGCDYPSEEF